MPSFLVFIIRDIAILSLLVGCSSVPKNIEEPKSIIIENEDFYANELTQSLNQAHGAWEDGTIHSTLSVLVKKISATSLELKNIYPAIKIKFLKTNGVLLLSGLANTLYISRGTLQMLQYENELIFCLSIPLALFKGKIPYKKFMELKAQNKLSLIKEAKLTKDDFFDFGEEAYFNADQQALKLMYNTRYDPRGADSFLRKWPSHSSPEQLMGKILPPTEERYQILRNEVAKLTPLQDPIVKSSTFDELLRHIKTIK